MSEFKIWESDTESEIPPTFPYCDVFESTVVWGRYEIFVDAARNLKHHLKTIGFEESERMKARLATILIDRINEGEEQPLIENELIKRLIQNSRPLSVATRARRLLTFMTKPEFPVSQFFSFGSDSELREALLGASESVNEREIQYFFSDMEASGLVESSATLGGGYQVTLQGHESVHQAGQIGYSNRVFVAMWFTDALDSLWNVIKDAVQQAGYEPIRVDFENHEGLIDDKIAAEIRGAKFVIADLTHGDDGHRGSVYYEIGFARGLNKPVIQTVQDDHLNDTVQNRSVAFDVSHYPVITWKSADLEAFKDALLNRIKSRFGQFS